MPQVKDNLQTTPCRDASTPAPTACLRRLASVNPKTGKLLSEERRGPATAALSGAHQPPRHEHLDVIRPLLDASRISVITAQPMPRDVHVQHPISATSVRLAFVRLPNQE
jgi:hypothetical protein